MKYSIILVALLAVASCATQKRCDQKFPPQKSVNIRDSLVIRDSVAMRDSVNIVSKDSFIIKESISGRDSIPCTEKTKTTIRRGGDVFNVSVNNGKVYFDYNLEGTVSRFSSTIQYLKSEISLLKESKSSHSEVKAEVMVSVITHVPWWVKILAWIGAISIIIMAFKFIMQKIS